MSHQRLTRTALLRGLGTAGYLALAGGAAGMARGRTDAFEVHFTQAEWRKRLGPERYNILREAGTERAGTSPLLNEHRRGIFACAGCNLPTFSSSTKFESGTGWPSFYRALPGSVRERSDRSLIEERTEILCRRCGGHMGHVFTDGPQPTGLRYCMNGLALVFHPQ
ncbi:MAG: peptide-methionine (R)-S-oxide reductase MsrB [Candidatus Eremiobacteraeota bacterium]|nr:peptide-methionine (R)-S-oxide reductase MsrB [Candidatus Eremiobacteraeota bacterium]